MVVKENPKLSRTATRRRKRKLNINKIMITLINAIKQGKKTKKFNEKIGN